MDLPTHFAFGILIGLVFFGGNPEAGLLIGFGALLPDLDREYWYVREQKYADEQYHRARFHNVFAIAAACLVSPYLSNWRTHSHASGFFHNRKGSGRRM